MSVTTHTNLLTVLPSPLILRGITWQTYENLLADLDEQSGTRLTYDRGVLEIMALTPEPEESLPCQLGGFACRRSGYGCASGRLVHLQTQRPGARIRAGFFVLLPARSPNARQETH